MFLARLVGGQTPNEGLVQVYHNNTWGWVCADHWDKRNADVACRMMDFDGSLLLNFSYIEDDKTNFKVWLNKMNCSGNESSFFECVHDGLGLQNCEGMRKAGVICRSKGNIAS